MNTVRSTFLVAASLAAATAYGVARTAFDHRATLTPVDLAALAATAALAGLLLGLAMGRPRAAGSEGRA